MDKAEALFEKIAYNTDFYSLGKKNKTMTTGLAWSRRGYEDVRGDMAYLSKKYPKAKFSIGVGQTPGKKDTDIVGKGMSAESATRLLKSKFKKGKGSSGLISATMPTSEATGADLRIGLKYKRPKGLIGKFKHKRVMKKTKSMTDDQLKAYIVK